MKEKVKVAVVQLAPKWLAREENAEKMRSFARKEAENGAELIVFPELANIGYVTPKSYGLLPDWDEKTTANEFAAMYVKASEPIPGPTTETLGEVCRKYGVYVAVGISQTHPVVKGTLYNSSALIGPQGVIGIHHKMHIPRQEKLFFYAGNTCEVFETPIGNIGLSICYDGRFPELTRILALKGAEIICSSWAIPETALSVVGDPNGLRYRAFTRAQENGNFYLACNRVGKEGATGFLGRSAIAAPNGTIIASSDTNEEEVITAVLESEQIIRYRINMTIFRDRRPELYHPIVEPLSQPYRPQTKPTSSQVTGSVKTDAAPVE